MIDLIRKNFWIVLIAAAFLLGILISPKPDKELREKYGKEREEIGKRIEEKEKEIQKLSLQGEEMRKKVREDSAMYAQALKTKDRNIHALEKEIQKVDYRNARARDLDSLRVILLRSGR